mmetsp:Transcript_17630/g.30879  ORF Transcript_17630/g.30879 Transcript_17630/m.30879 type:complete len:151 (+) Transcript_17630:110-562(+)
MPITPPLSPVSPVKGFYQGNFETSYTSQFGEFSAITLPSTPRKQKREAGSSSLVSTGSKFQATVPESAPLRSGRPRALGGGLHWPDTRCEVKDTRYYNPPFADQPNSPVAAKEYACGRRTPRSRHHPGKADLPRLQPEQMILRDAKQTES